MKDIITTYSRKMDKLLKKEEIILFIIFLGAAALFSVLFISIYGG